jgi:glutathione synthase/RimK-type ligase-like ATP-grasp enzyme
MSTIHVLHENPEWTGHLFEVLDARRLRWQSWDLADGVLDLSQPPPAGIWFSRMSASAGARGHDAAPARAMAMLSWLEGNGARVLNGTRALQLELSKAAQYAALKAAGIAVPYTVAVAGRDGLLDAAAGMPLPFVVKPNRGGRGDGVRRFDCRDAFARWLYGPEFEPSPDGVHLLQQFIVAKEPAITRLEFVGGRLLYAVRVDTSQGFDLCPADACAVPFGDARFNVLSAFRSPLVDRYRQFLAIKVAGLEFVVDADGKAWTYDVNTNTNYNRTAEAAAGVSGWSAVADLLTREVHRATVEPLLLHAAVGH